MQTVCKLRFSNACLLHFLGYLKGDDSFGRNSLSIFHETLVTKKIIKVTSKAMIVNHWTSLNLERRSRAMPLSIADRSFHKPGSSFRISGIPDRPPILSGLNITPISCAIALVQIKQPLSHWLPPHLRSEEDDSKGRMSSHATKRHTSLMHHKWCVRASSALLNREGHPSAPDQKWEVP
jgi:hypothetical protein